MVFIKNISKTLAATAIAVSSLSHLSAADTQTLLVEYTLDKAVQAIWQGDDTVETGGGDGKLVLDPAAPKTATLRVQCNSTNGYNVKFSSGNATGLDAAIMVKGAGGDAALEIPYNVALDITGITNATAASSLNLQDAANNDVNVTFPDPGDILPMDASSAHPIKMVVSLGSFDPYFKEEGLYQDTITATVSIN